MRKLMPILLALFGIGAGAGAGLALRPDPEMVATEGSPDSTGGATCPAPEKGAAPEAASAEPDDAAHEFVKLNNQFIVPVVEEGSVRALAIMSVSLEVAAGATDRVYAFEPKLRDGLLQVLFDHANAGGFSGDFTGSARMGALRRALLEAAQKTLGPAVDSVLVTDFVKQST